MHLHEKNTICQSDRPTMNNRKRPSNEKETQAPSPKRTKAAQPTLSRHAQLIDPQPPQSSRVSRPDSDQLRGASQVMGGAEVTHAPVFNSRTLSKLPPSHIAKAQAILGCGNEQCLRTYFDCDRMTTSLQQLIYLQQKGDQSQHEEVQRLKDELRAEKQLRQEREEQLAEVKEENENLSESMQMLYIEKDCIAKHNDELEGIQLRIASRRTDVAVQTDAPQSQDSHEPQLDNDVSLLQDTQSSSRNDNGSLPMPEGPGSSAESRDRTGLAVAAQNTTFRIINLLGITETNGINTDGEPSSFKQQKLAETINELLEQGASQLSANIAAHRQEREQQSAAAEDNGGGPQAKAATAIKTVPPMQMPPTKRSASFEEKEHRPISVYCAPAPIVESVGVKRRPSGQSATSPATTDSGYSHDLSLRNLTIDEMWADLAPRKFSPSCFDEYNENDHQQERDALELSANNACPMDIEENAAVGGNEEQAQQQQMTETELLISLYAENTAAATTNEEHEQQQQQWNDDDVAVEETGNDGQGKKKKEANCNSSSASAGHSSSPSTNGNRNIPAEGGSNEGGEQTGTFAAGEGEADEQQENQQRENQIQDASSIDDMNQVMLDNLCAFVLESMPALRFRLTTLRAVVDCWWKQENLTGHLGQQLGAADSVTVMCIKATYLGIAEVFATQNGLNLMNLNGGGGAEVQGPSSTWTQ